MPQPNGYVLPTSQPLGPEDPLATGSTNHEGWTRYFWAEEARRYFDDLFLSDRDFREVLTGRHSYVNGPLARYYRSGVNASFRDRGEPFGYVEPEPLFRPDGIPEDLEVSDVGRWVRVEDRGEHAAGILTMPIFLTKYGSRRSRAHVLYQVFQCREFVAENLELRPSNEPNLMKRDGCSACHLGLEPMSAYFTRVLESDMTFLPKAFFPVDNEKCRNANPARMPGTFTPFYDRAFTNASQCLLRGGYGSPENADKGPKGLAAALVADQAFPQCVAQNVASSFLGRPLGPDDGPLKQRLAATLQSNGFRMRALVRELLLSDAYRRANNRGARSADVAPRTPDPRSPAEGVEQ